MKNRLRQLLDQGSPAFGTIVTIPDSSVVEIVALSGFDFAFFDIEHAAMGLETLQNQLRAGLAHGLGTLVRMSGSDHASIARTLDIGADGILVTDINSQKDAAELVSIARFPPVGRRGVSTITRSAEFGGHGLGSMRDLAEARNREVVVGALIEDKVAVDEIDSILSTPGLDFVYIGPNDLSASMGLIGTKGHPLVREAFDRVVSACSAAKVPFATAVGHPVLPFTGPELVERGAKLLTTGADCSVLLNGLKALRSQLNT